ncbi:MAG: DNA repair protein [Planctomycetota bacterium]|nr:MAG: DNA repair protein [Planctomycetota bacterium]
MPSRTTTTPRHPAAGHRQRLRERLERAGLDALADYEILEFLLGIAIRGRDVKPLARALLKAFGGSLGRLLDAQRADILAVPGAGPAVADALLAARTASVAALLPLEDPERAKRVEGESRHRVVKTALLSRGTVDRAVPA